MGDFRQERGKRFDGGHGGGFDRRDGDRPRKSWGGSGGRDRGPVAMHQAVCDQCGKPCEVPFRPTVGKPVYCNVCFGNKKGAVNNRGGDRFPRSSKGDNDELKKQFDILNAKLDRIIKDLTPEESMAKGNNSRRKETKKPKKNKKK